MALGCLVIAILYLNAFQIEPLANSTRDWGFWGRLVQATVLPYSTWFLNLAMLTLLLGERSVSLDPGGPEYGSRQFLCGSRA